MNAETDTVLRSSIETQWKEMTKVTEAFPKLRMILPNMTFEDKLLIHGSARTVELYCYGGGNTPSDAFLYLPEEKIAFMGDLVLENHYPPIHNSQEFIANLTKVKELDIQTFVTGHQHTVGKSQIEVMLAYLSHFNEKVQVTIEKGEFLEQLLSTDTPNDYSNWTGIDGYKRSLTSVFNERKELNLN
jgi:cyclase